jgi:hypothetical protein
MVGFLLTVFLVACTKTATEINEEVDEQPIYANYTVLLKENSNYSIHQVSSEESGVFDIEVESSFPDFLNNEISARTRDKVGFYSKTSDCLGEVLLYDFTSKITTQLTVYEDLGICNLETTAMAHNTEYIFLSYNLSLEGKSQKYFLRTMAVDDPIAFTELELAFNPISLVSINDRLFVLTKDAEVTDEFKLFVVDIPSNEIILEKNLGYDVNQIFKNSQNDIIISYNELHTVLHSATLSVTYTNYGEATAPNFGDSAHISFDSEGKMYYDMFTEDQTATQSIAAVYDFEANSAVLYYFENFLTTEQLSVEYDILKATAITYDETNNLILIGYAKKSSSNKGGILRITPAPDLTFVDNVNLDGIPQSIKITH